MSLSTRTRKQLLGSTRSGTEGLRCNNNNNKWRYVFAAPRPRSAFVSFRVKEGAAPCTEGIRRNMSGRQQSAEVTQCIYDDVIKNVEQGMITIRQRGGPCPAGMWVNPYHVVIKQTARESNASGKPAIKVRLCLDARYLNKHLVDSAVTWLPDLRDMINGLHGLKIASAFDVSQAFQQMQVPEELRHYLGFVILEPGTGIPLWCEHSAGMFGLTSLPGNFHGNLEQRLRRAFEAAVQLQSFLSLFIDDTGAFTYANPARGTSTPRPAPDSEEMREIVTRHMALLDTTLRCFWDAGLSVKLEKCYFLSRVAYLVGVQSDGVTHSLDLKSSQGIASALTGPPSLKYLQAQLGQAVYVSGYLDSVRYLEHSGPLYDLCTLVVAEDKANGAPAAKALLKRLWSPLHEQCISFLHTIIKDRYALLFPDTERPLWVLTDASNYGAGCVAGQFHPITGKFMVCVSLARRFSRAQQSWSVGGRECWGTLIFMRKYWKLFSVCDVIWGGDHNNLLTVDQLEHAHVLRWLSEMATLCPSYLLRRVHLNGEAIALSDFLSRWCLDAPTTRDLAAKVNGKKPPYTSLFGGVSAPEITVEQDEGDAPPAQLGSSRPLVPRAAMPTVGSTASPSQQLEERLSLGLPASPASSATAAPAIVASPPPRVVARRHTWEPSPFLSSIASAQQQISPAELSAIEANLNFSTLTLYSTTFLCLESRLYIPNTAESLIQEICKNIHEVSLSGIPGTHGADPSSAARALAASRLWVNNFSSIYKRYVAACPRCQQTNQAAPHLPLIIPQPTFRAGHAVMMDYLDVAPSTSGENSLLVTIDMASRFTLLWPVKNKTSHEVKEALRTWRRRFGRLPVLALSDQGSHFTSKSLQEWFTDHGITSESLESTAYNPQGRGRVEATNRRILHWLKVTLPAGKSDLWITLVDEMEIALNASPIKSTGISPFEFLYNHPPLLPTQWLDPFAALDASPESFAAASLSTQARQYLASVRAELLALHDAAQRNASVRPQTFELGEPVLIYHPKQADKLGQAWRAIFEVVDVERDASGARTHFYTVKYCLPGHSSARPLLGPPLFVRSTRIRQFNASRTSPAAEAEREVPHGWHIVDAILQGPRQSQDPALAGHFLVQWHGAPAPTWEPASSLIGNALFNQFCTENKLSPKGIPQSAAQPRALKKQPKASSAPLAAAQASAAAEAPSTSSTPTAPLAAAQASAAAEAPSPSPYPPAVPTPASAQTAPKPSKRSAGKVADKAQVQPSPAGGAHSSTNQESQRASSGTTTRASTQQEARVAFWQPHMNDRVEARQHEHGQWHGAIVRALGPESAQVKWDTSGTIETLPLHYIRPFPSRRAVTTGNGASGTF